MLHTPCACQTVLERDNECQLFSVSQKGFPQDESNSIVQSFKMFDRPLRSLSPSAGAGLRSGRPTQQEKLKVL